jgi:hypothetical protein
MKSFPGFFPRKDGERARWAENYKLKLPVRGPEVSLSPQTIARNLEAAQRIIDVVMFVDMKKKEYDAALSLRDEVLATEGKLIGNTAAIMKKDANYTEPLGEEVGIIGGTRLHHEAEIYPKIKATAYSSFIEISFIKKYTHGISLYSRKVGQGKTGEWEHIGYCRLSPFVDKRPLAAHNVPEVREYQARCMKFMDEIGQFSSIVSTVYAGPRIADDKE